VAPAQPPPPAPPAPPAAVQAFVVQPGTVTNPALVPAEQERDVALRYAATGLRPAGPLEELWLMWIVAATMIAVAGFAIGRRRVHRAPAWATAWSSKNRPPQTTIHREIGLGD
jgi:hypothetical protein